MDAPGPTNAACPGANSGTYRYGFARYPRSKAPSHCRLPMLERLSTRVTPPCRLVTFLDLQYSCGRSVRPTESTSREKAKYGLTFFCIRSKPNVPPPVM